MEKLTKNPFLWNACLADKSLESQYRQQQNETSRPFMLAAIGILLGIELLGFSVDFWAHTGAAVDTGILFARLFAIALGISCGLSIYLSPAASNIAKHTYLVGIMIVFMWTLISYDPTDYLLPISLIGTALVLYLALPMPWLYRIFYSLSFTIVGTLLWSNVHPIDEHFFRILVWLVFANTTGTIAAYYDNRNRRQLFLQDKQLKQQLESEQQLLQRNDNLMSLISHELRTPLTTINIQADLLQRATSTQGNSDTVTQIRKIANTIANNSQSLLHILQSWLTANQRSGFEVESRIHEPLAIIATTIADSKQHFPDLLVKLDAKSINISVNFDDRVLQLSLQSLIVNAYLHGNSTQGSRIKCYTTPTQFHIAIRDWGKGMSADQLGNLFSRRPAISQTDGNRGLGIGLHLLHRLIDTSGGNIKAYSCKDVGTLMVLILPR